MQDFGRSAFVVRNSGIEHFGVMGEVRGEDIDRVLDIEVEGQYSAAQDTHRHISDNGRLILTSFIAAQKITDSVAKMWYCGTCLVKNRAWKKTQLCGFDAIQGIVRCLGCDFGPRNIGVNCIAAGGVKTDMYSVITHHYIEGSRKKMSEEENESALSKWPPLGRVGIPEDVAGIIFLLANSLSQCLTGQTFHASRGAFKTRRTEHQEVTTFSKSPKSNKGVG